MTIRALMLAFLSLLLSASCSGAESRGTSPLLVGLEGAPAVASQGCQLAAKRCVQCHPVERVLRANLESPEHWKRYVTRMHRMPGSQISPGEVEPITQCLVFRSFGEVGIRELDTEREESP